MPRVTSPPCPTLKPPHPELRRRPDATWRTALEPRSLQGTAVARAPRWATPTRDLARCPYCTVLRTGPTPPGAAAPHPTLAPLQQETWRIVLAAGEGGPPCPTLTRPFVPEPHSAFMLSHVTVDSLMAAKRREPWSWSTCLPKSLNDFAGADADKARLSLQVAEGIAHLRTARIGTSSPKMP